LKNYQFYGNKFNVVALTNSYEYNLGKFDTLNQAQKKLNEILGEN
jgi:hypothetical protein